MSETNPLEAAEFAPATTPVVGAGRLFEVTEADLAEVDAIVAEFDTLRGPLAWGTLVKLYDVACYVYLRRCGRRGQWVRR